MHFIQSLARKQGIAISRKPPSMVQDGAELTLSLEYIVAHYALTNPDAFFVQVGAYDGTSNDPLLHIVQHYGWKGVLVEPQNLAFKKLERLHAHNSQIVVRNVAMAREDGKRTLYSLGVHPGLPEWAYQIASFNKSHILKQQRYLHGWNVNDLLVADEVDCITFDTLLKEMGSPHVDILQIDTEGFDYEIIKMFQVEERKPSIINFEHLHLSRKAWNEAVALLVECGYKVAKAGWGDTLAYQERG